MYVMHSMMEVEDEGGRGANMVGLGTTGWDAGRGKDGGSILRES